MIRFPKYRNKKVQHEGHSFASKLEAAVYQVLKLRQKAGEIDIIKHQDYVYLSQARIPYIVDFKIFDWKLGDFSWVEAKGFETPEWRIKKRLWSYYGPGPLEIYRGSEKKPFLDEVLHLKEHDNTIQCPACNHKFSGVMNDSAASDETVAKPTADNNN